MTALKLLNEELFSDTELRARFEREADLVAQLEHPNIVTVFDRGADAGRLWISMQYVDGVDAATVEPLTLPPDRAVQIVAETAKALDFAHRRGVLHRDVKPANILLAKSADAQQRVYLTDFGIARVVDDAGSRLTRTGTFTATLDFASPEQLTGAQMDGRADQYSLACTLYWLLTGAAPFESVQPAAVIQGHLQQPPPAPSTVRAGLPAALDAVLARAMAKRPADRYASCTEFAEAARQTLTVAAAPPATRPATPAQPMPVPQPGAVPQPVPVLQPGAVPQPIPMPQRSAVPPRQPMPYAPPQQQYAPQYGYRPMPPRERSNTGLVVGLSLGLVLVIAVGVGIWAALANRTPPQRYLGEAQQAFAQVLPQADVPAGQEYGSGRGFGEINCSGKVFSDRLKVDWFWMADQPDPEIGTPLAQWQCSYAGSYMVPEGLTLARSVRSQVRPCQPPQVHIARQPITSCWARGCRSRGDSGRASTAAAVRGCGASLWPRSPSAKMSATQPR
ncbi:protein kinase [Nocardia sp. NPDC059177]|uniref:serine/threonine-protein kinase n=1 Tax=Nocardia sp. NPDC059177 TaxID=3346759 RepID=UPI00368D2C39